MKITHLKTAQIVSNRPVRSTILFILMAVCTVFTYSPGVGSWEIVAAILLVAFLISLAIPSTVKEEGGGSLGGHERAAEAPEPTDPSGSDPEATVAFSPPRPEDADTVQFEPPRRGRVREGRTQEYRNPPGGSSS